MPTPTIHIRDLCKTYIVTEREKAFLRQITLVMGQRNQLVWDTVARSIGGGVGTFSTGDLSFLRRLQANLLNPFAHAMALFRTL